MPRRSRTVLIQYKSPSADSRSCFTSHIPGRRPEMDDERFILEVEKHPVLYDTINPYYKDNSKKNMAWSLIAEVVGVEIDVCRARWKSLRDAFVKNRKNKNLPSGSAGENQKDWKYSEIMSFLLPHLHPRSLKSNQIAEHGGRSASPLPSLGADERSSTPGISLQRSISVSPAPSDAAPTTCEDRERPSSSRSLRERTFTHAAERAPQKRRKSHRQQTTDIGERLMSLLQEPIPKPHMPETEHDEAYHFALSLVPMLHRLDKDRRRQAKMDILNTLHNLEKDQQNQTVPQQHAAGWQTILPPTYTPQPPGTQDDMGHLSQTSMPENFQPVDFPPQGVKQEDESTGGSYYNDL